MKLDGRKNASCLISLFSFNITQMIRISQILVSIFMCFKVQEWPHWDFDILYQTGCLSFSLFKRQSHTTELGPFI